MLGVVLVCYVLFLGCGRGCVRVRGGGSVRGG